MQALKILLMGSFVGAGQRIRVVGSGLSPNGMAFSPQGMLSTALLDKVITVDAQKQQVTLQAGARVDQVREPPSSDAVTLLDLSWYAEVELEII